MEDTHLHPEEGAAAAEAGPLHAQEQVRGDMVMEHIDMEKMQENMLGNVMGSMTEVKKTQDRQHEMLVARDAQHRTDMEAIQDFLRDMQGYQPDPDAKRVKTQTGVAPSSSGQAALDQHQPRAKLWGLCARRGKPQGHGHATLQRGRKDRHLRAKRTGRA